MAMQTTRAFLTSLLLLSASVHASIIDFSVTINTGNNAQPNWIGPGPVPSVVTGSFLVDTSDFDNAQITFGSFDSPGIKVGQMLVSGLGVSAIRFFADGISLWSSDSAAGTLLVDYDRGGRYQGEFRFDDGGRSFGNIDARWPFFAPDGYTLQRFMQSPDPFADFLTQANLGIFVLRGDWGSLLSFSQDVTTETRVVPEPGTLALMCGGLVFLPLLIRRRMRTDPQPAA